MADRQRQSIFETPEALARQAEYERELRELNDAVDSKFDRLLQLVDRIEGSQLYRVREKLRERLNKLCVELSVLTNINNSDSN